MKKESILIVDDEILVREMIRDMLDAEGYRTTAVDSGQSALKIAQEAGFDLVLADIKMPEMSGLELVEKLQHYSPDLVSILVTGYASVATARQAIQQGVYDYIVKPFDRSELTAAVEGALIRKRLAEENARLKSLVGLLQVSQAVAASSEYTQLLEFIVRTAIERTRSMGGCILLFDVSTQGITMAAMLGPGRYAAHVADTILRNGVVSVRAEVGRGILFTDREQHPLFELVQHRYFDGELRASELRGGEILLLPIEAGHEISGMLCMCRGSGEGPLMEADLELLRILAAEASVAVRGYRSLSKMEGDCLACLRSLAALVDARSPYTKGHMERVARLSRQLARKLGLTKEEVELVGLAASLHDLGKIGAGLASSSRPGELSIEEHHLARRHPVIADEILASLPFLSDARAIIRHHHEQWDGKGYPDGLSGKEITTPMHVVILANAYDNLTSGCAGKQAIHRSEAIVKLREAKGTVFDPEIADSFIDML